MASQIVHKSIRNALYIIDCLDLWTKRIIILFMAAMTIIVALNVVFRYILNISIVWSEELSIYLLIWSSFLAAAVAFRQGTHVAFTIVINKFHPNRKLQ